MNKNLLCVGFSVTEEREGYVKELQDILSADFISVKKFSIGGATFAVLPYFLHELLSDNKGAIVLFEVATCYRFKESVSQYVAILNEIFLICEYYECNPIFLNLYRDGVDYRSDLLVTAIESACAKKGIISVDAYNDIRYEFDKTKYLRDGVHTTEFGAKYYAKLIAPYIQDALANNYSVFDRPSLMNIADLAEGAEVRFFSRGGMEASYIDINQGNHIEVDFPKPMLLCGIVYLMGPKSGVLDLVLPENGFRRSVHMYDERSYYIRCSYQFMPEQAVKKIRLEQRSERADVALIKGERYEGELVGSVVGFLVRSLKFNGNCKR